MKEHPEYKYRPRRKPKPLIKKDGSPAGVGPSAFAAKFNIPMHFFPPGFDPASALARSLFGHYAQGQGGPLGHPTLPLSVEQNPAMATKSGSKRVSSAFL